MNEIMSLALLGMLAATIADIGYACYKDGPMGPPRRGTQEEGAGVMESIDKLREHMRKHGVLALPSDILGYIDAIEKELAERYMELPLDADGVPVRVGDMVQEADAAPRKVIGVTADGYMAWNVGVYEAIRCHHQPDSWERIIADAYMRGAHDQYIEDGRVLEVGFKSDYDLVARCKALASEGA